MVSYFNEKVYKTIHSTSSAVSIVPRNKSIERASQYIRRAFIIFVTNDERLVVVGGTASGRGTDDGRRWTTYRGKSTRERKSNMADTSTSVCATCSPGEKMDKDRIRRGTKRKKEKERERERDGEAHVSARPVEKGLR